MNSSQSAEIFPFPNSGAVRSIPIARVFQELDSYVAERLSDYRYDVDAGLARFKRATHTDVRSAQKVATEEAGDRQDWAQVHQGPATVYLTELETKPLRITSRNTDAFAARLTKASEDERWLVSWLPELVMTRNQVFSAMVLDEILIAHDLDSATMLKVMGELAADLYLPLENLLRRLSSVKNPQPRPAWLLQAWSP